MRCKAWPVIASVLGLFALRSLLWGLNAWWPDSTAALVARSDSHEPALMFYTRSSQALAAEAYWHQTLLAPGERGALECSVIDHFRPSSC